MSKWYPNFRSDVPQGVQEAVRRMLDFIYELRDQLGPLGLWAKSNEQLTVGIVRTAIPGCQLVLPRSGQWLISGTYTVIVDGDGAKLFTGSLRVGAEQQLSQALLKIADGTTVSFSQQWFITASTNTEVSLEIVKEDTASGDSTAEKEHCTISATWQGRTT